MKPAVEWISSPSLPRLDFPSRLRDEVVGERDALERGSEHELAGMEDERLVVRDLDELRQLLLLRLDVDVRVARVAEDPEVAVDADVDAGGLHQRGLVRLDADAALAQQAPDSAIGEDHAAILRRHLR